MYPLRTHASIHHSAQHHPDPALRELKSRRIEELTDYTEDLAEMINIYILEPSSAGLMCQESIGLPPLRRMGCGYLRRMV